MEINKKSILDKNNKSLEKNIRTEAVSNLLESNKIKNLNINHSFDKDMEEYKENTKDIEKELESELTNPDLDEDILEEDLIFKSILEDLNKNIYINIKQQEEEKNQMACKELLQIMKDPYCDFKPFSKPRKVSMIGRVFFNDNNNNEDTKTSDKASSE